VKIEILKNIAVRVPRRMINKLAAQIGRGENNSKALVNIIFVNDIAIKKLNAKYRYINKPTDVLSFNFDSAPGKDAILGEIYISVETAARYAAEDGLKFNYEILKLCCHGLLHLLGYDHMKPGEAARMESKEKYYLSKVR
jgi:probable rRNA maturation factor